LATSLKRCTHIPLHCASRNLHAELGEELGEGLWGVVWVEEPCSKAGVQWVPTETNCGEELT